MERRIQDVYASDSGLDAENVLACPLPDGTAAYQLALEAARDIFAKILPHAPLFVPAQPDGSIAASSQDDDDADDLQNLEQALTNLESSYKVE